MNILRVFLALSLAVNLFIAGWWVGDALRRPPMGGPPVPRVMSFADRIADRVSAEGRESVQGTFAQIDSVIRAGFEERAATFARLRDMLQDDGFDVDAFSALIMQLPQQRETAEIEQWMLVRDAILKLSAEDRRVVAEMFFLPPGPPPPPRGQDWRAPDGMMPPPPPFPGSN